MSRRPCPPSQPFAPQSGLKMKAFTLNMSGKKLLSKKDQEKQKQAEDEAAAALAYDDFVKTFDQPVASSKMFVKEDAAGGGGAGGTCPSPLSLLLVESHAQAHVVRQAHFVCPEAG